MTALSKTQTLANLEGLIAGLEKHLPTYEFIVRSRPESSAQVLAALKRRARLARAVLEARAALATALLESEAEDAATADLFADVRQMVSTMYANSPSMLGDFAVETRKERTPPTAEELVLTVAKRAATRAARHTMGPRQKEKIHGDLTGTIVVALDGSVSVAPAPPPAPAPVPERPTEGRAPAAPA